MNESYAIETHQLRKEYGRKVAVADLTLQVPRGEVFGFLGPNGAGKTTAVKMLLGLTGPTAGSGRVLGKPLGDTANPGPRSDFCRNIFAFTSGCRRPNSSICTANCMAYRPNSAPAASRNYWAWWASPRLPGRRLSAFSKGMLQRIGLAQALLSEPEMVFMDEPTSGLDPLGRRLVRDIIRRLKDACTTVFLNSHLLSEGRGDL